MSSIDDILEDASALLRVQHLQEKIGPGELPALLAQLGVQRHESSSVLPLTALRSGGKRNA